MEFLTRTLNSAEIYYVNISEVLGKIIRETKVCLTNATLDLSIDLERKINHRINSDNFVEQIIKNLNIAAKNIQYFPKEHKISSFTNIESEIIGLFDFIHEYSSNAIHFINGFDLAEKKLLINKVLNIKSRRKI